MVTAMIKMYIKARIFLDLEGFGVGYCLITSVQSSGKLVIVLW